MNLLTKLQSHKYYHHILILCITITFWLSYNIYVWANTQSTDNAYIESDISVISSEVNGTVAEVFIKENENVEEGQVIAKIHDSEYRMLYEKAQAELNAALYKKDMLSQEIKIAIIDLERSKNALNYSMSELALSKSDLGRAQELNKDKFASKKLLQDASISVEKFENSFLSSKLSVEAAQENLELLELKKLSALSNIEIANKMLSIATRNLSNTEIKSPIKGIVSNCSYLKLGSFVHIGTPILSVVPTDKIYIKANFKETQVQKLAPSMKVEIYIDAAKGEKIIGKIRNVSPTTGAKFSLIPPDNATGNFTKIVQRVPVIIDLELPKNLIGKIISGMSAKVYVKTN